MKKLFSSIVCSVLCSALIGATAIASPYFNTDKINDALNSINSINTVMQGDEDGNMRIDDTLTRAEMAAIIARYAVYGDPDVKTKSYFTDLEECFAKNYVLVLNEKGIVNGYEDETFRPNENVTYGEYITTLVRFYQYENSLGQKNFEFPGGYTEEARRLGIITYDIIDLNDFITRGEAAVMTANTLSIQLSNGSTLKDILTERARNYEELLVPTPSVTQEPAATFNPDVQNAFAYRMNAEIEKDNNYMFSPLSIKTALAMAANGADGDTKSEILKTLGITDLLKFNQETKELIKRYKGDFDLDRYNELAKKFNEIYDLSDQEHEEFINLSEQLNSGKTTQMNIANSIWINNDYYPNNNVKFNSIFEKTITDYYNGTSETVNNSDAVERINNWVSEKTNEKIPSIINNSEFLASIINAVYFKADWENKFFEANTKKSVFNNTDRTISETDFMNNTGYYKTYTDGSIKMIALPYKGDATMYISIDNGSNIDYNSYFDKLKIDYVNLSMPKFKIEYENDIGISNKDCLLKNLGINTAFNQNLADFKNMFDNVPSNDNVYIDNVKHKTYISVDEKGTEAAAVTAVMMGATGALPPQPIDFIINMPFTFMIRDELSGEILFMGRYSKVE